MKTIEQSLKDRILYIGNDIPESLAKDTRDKFILLGSPQAVIDETSPQRVRSFHDTVVWIADYLWKRANPESKFNEPPSMVYEQVEKDYGKFLTENA